MAKSDLTPSSNGTTVTVTPDPFIAAANGTAPVLPDPTPILPTVADPAATIPTPPTGRVVIGPNPETLIVPVDTDARFVTIKGKKVTATIAGAAIAPTAKSKLSAYANDLRLGRPAPVVYDVVKDEGKPTETRREHAGIIRILAACGGAVVTPDGFERSSGKTSDLAKGEFLADPSDIRGMLQAAAEAAVKPGAEAAAQMQSVLDALLAIE